MADSEYREQKIAFVSNLNGTTALEVTFHSLYVSLVIATSRVLYRRFIPDLNNWITAAFLNFVTTAIPLILGVTFLADYIVAACFACLIIITFCHFISLKSEKSEKAKAFLNTDASSSVSVALNDNRYILFYGTTVAILAVDFTIFPRRLAKTELYGFSVMDVGVGLFGFYYGFFARETRFPPRFLDFRNFFEAMRSTLPLSVIAFGRLIVVKLSGYPEHVTEYGVHWNFFFTLIFVRVGVSLVLLLFPNPRYVGFVSLAMFALYSWFVATNAGYSDWLVNTPEDRKSLNLIEQNKEGIISLPGFVTIYLLAMQVGSIMRPVLSTKNLLPVRRVLSILVKLLVGAFISAQLAWFAHSYFQPCSRRLANFAYIFWLMFNYSIMQSVCLVGALLTVFLDTRLSKSSSSNDLLFLPRAFNSNTLALFLLANILTGLVNISIKTILVEPMPAFLIVTLYCFIVSFIAAFLHAYKINLKFW